MPRLPSRIKFARVHIDRDDRVHFLARHEIETEEGWWESALSDPRAASLRPPINDTMLGHFRGMYVEIFCGNCRSHEWRKIDDLLVMYGDRCAVAQAVNVQVNCKRPAKRCDVQFKIRQWDDVARLKKRGR